MSPRRCLASLALALALAAPAASAVAQELPATKLAYTLKVELEPQTRALTGSARLRWTHPGDAPVQDVPLHLYLNAFAHSQTTWMGAGPLRTVRFDRLRAMYGDDIWGWIELDKVRLLRGDGDALTLTPTFIQPDDHNPLDRTLVNLHLPEPLLPGQTLELDIDFSARLPIPIARTGGYEDYFLVAQWFPKIAAYETVGVRQRAVEGFSAQQFHGPTEFYADFADYDVTITAPTGWTLGATGLPVSDQDDGQVHTVRYTQRAVHDFAFVASTALTERTLTYTPAGQREPVALRILAAKGADEQLPRWEQALKAGLDVMTTRVGPWPYPQLTAVLPPWRGVRTSGMEYPTFITGLPADPAWSHPLLDDLRFAEVVLIHEFIHQYFYGLLANNEREEAWLDEGFTTYWEGEVARATWGPGDAIGEVLGRHVDNEDLRNAGLRSWGPSLDEPLARRPTWLYYPGTSGAQSYPRTALTLRTAARLYGQERLDAVFAAWFRRFAFRHPGLDDFLATAAEVGGEGLGAFLREALHQPRLPDLRVVTASASPWSPPSGRAPEDVLATWPASAADEADGRVLIEITDPGWARPDARQDGAITQARVAPIGSEPSLSPADSSSPIYESVVRARGPGWEHLPVTARFTFEDGVVVEDAWDGRAAWRAWRFLRRSPLQRVDLDPERRIALDVVAENNSATIQPDHTFAADWSLWLAAIIQWLSQVAPLWL